MPSHSASLYLFATHIKDRSAAAAAAAKSLQSCPTLCYPIDGSPPGSASLGFSRQEHWSGLPFPSPMHESEKWKQSRSVLSDFSRLHARDQACTACLGWQILNHWTTREIPRHEVFSVIDLHVFFSFISKSHIGLSFWLLQTPQRIDFLWAKPQTS